MVILVSDKLLGSCLCVVVRMTLVRKVSILTVLLCGRGREAVGQEEVALRGGHGGTFGGATMT